MESSVLASTSLDNAPFDRFTGIDVWRQLVKVCSGLDSFMIGELQVMSQFRGSVAWHRKHGLTSDINGSFFDHVISANRVIRREFGFNKTTESMLNLATTALEEVVSKNPHSISAVLGFGEMGCKAVEVLLDLGQTDITVISRSPEDSAKRNPQIAAKVKLMTLEQWKELDHQPSLIISTIRNTVATYNSNNPIPTTAPAKIMDFSWPPSIDSTGIGANQDLMGMVHWIKIAHKLGVEWDYSSTIEKSELMITDIQQRFMSALTDRTQAKFRSFMYQTLESLSKQWVEYEHAIESEAQLEAFSREIATWLCNQDGPFATDELGNMVLSTDRPINPTLLKRVASDVTETIIRINEKSTLSEVTH